MANFTKFEIFSEHLAKGVHDLFNNTLKVYLTNAAPNSATHQVKQDLAEINAENGYTAGGADIDNTGNRSGGKTTITGQDVTFTAQGGQVGPFRYAVLYNDTPADPSDPLIGYWDYGQSITLQDGESFVVDLVDAANALLEIE